MSDDNTGEGTPSSTQETKVVPPKVEPTVSVEDFVKMQKALEKSESNVASMEADKVESSRKTALASLKRINPKLADMNKDASESTLNAVIMSVESMSKGFQKHHSNKTDDATKEATVDNHDSSSYDFVNGKWMYQ